MDLLLDELESTAAAADALVREIERELRVTDLRAYRSRRPASRAHRPEPPAQQGTPPARRATYLRLVRA